MDRKKKKLSKIVSTIRNLDRSWLPSAPSSLAAPLRWLAWDTLSPFSRADEMNQIHDLLKECRAPELNEVRFYIWVESMAPVIFFLRIISCLPLSPMLRISF